MVKPTRWMPVEDRDLKYVITRLTNVSQYSFDVFTALIAHWNENPDLTNTSIAAKFNVSAPTVTRWRAIINDSIIERREKREKAAAIQRATGEKTILAPDQIAETDLSPEEMVKICDARIRALFKEGGKDADIQKWMDFKVKFQGVSGAPVATTIDPHRLLGPQGLAATQTEFLRRIEILARHHTSFPDLFKHLRDIVNNLPEVDDALPSQNPFDEPNPWEGVEHPQLEPEPEPEPEEEEPEYIELDSGFEEAP